ncbi:SMP-30/gluconolactonase/LRE family protein [Fluviibacterium sp. DFM31]|uniref:SMP-30/gluconolactonase/LRE family protein n=1 Tax=Meridianimarinicoccus marinus TaxID=3231483 RepID=A0ABV3LB59_9RHOB
MDGNPDKRGKTDGAQPGMQALTRGLAVIEMVAASDKPQRFTSLLEASGLPKGTLHRILQTLVDERYLALDAQVQTYRLGSRPFELAHRVWDQFDLRGAAEPELVRMRDLTGETVRLGVLSEGEVLYIDQREKPQPIRIANGVGSRAALHASAMGKAIAAHLGMAERHRLAEAEFLTAFTDRTVVTGGDLDQQLNIIKARGYAISVEELHEGISGVAAAILDHNAEPLGAVGIVGPSFRLSEERLHALGREVIEAARRISGNIGELAMSINVNPRPSGTGEQNVHVAVPGMDFLAEGPHWSEAEGRLHWVDILAPSVVTGDPARGTRQQVELPELVGCVVPRVSGGFVVATETGVKLMDADGALRLLAEPEADIPGNRFNDGKCDRQGRFWVGSLAINTAPGHGNLWRIDADGSSHRMDSGIHISNGLGWSPDDRTMYFTDSGSREIFAYDFDAARGTIANRRVFVRLDESFGVPDGLTVDAEGHVWTACWDGWAVVRFDPQGKVDRVIDVPVPRPTSCTFGGPDLSTLFITTARIRLSSQVLAEAPLSGSLLSVDTGVRGQPETRFAG